jgi:hypothetical protein
MTIFAATYASVSDAMWTHEQLQNLKIPPADISVGISPAIRPVDFAASLVRDGISVPVATHLARAVERGEVLVMARLEEATLREQGELIMASRAQCPDLVGEINVSITPPAKLAELRASTIDRPLRPAVSTNATARG